MTVVISLTLLPPYNVNKVVVVVLPLFTYVWHSLCDLCMLCMRVGPLLTLWGLIWRGGVFVFSGVFFCCCCFVGTANANSLPLLNVVLMNKLPKRTLSFEDSNGKRDKSIKAFTLRGHDE